MPVTTGEGVAVGPVKLELLAGHGLDAHSHWKG
jgi:hypothetical protein